MRTKLSILQTKNSELSCIFALSLFFTLFGFLLIPQYKILYFIPLFVRAFYLKSYNEALWLSCLCGLIIDLLSSHVRFGIHAVTYKMATAILYSQKRNFFEDSTSTLPGLTFIYSVVSSLILMFLLLIFEKGITISFDFVKIDLGFLPFLDALYAFCSFSIPKLLFGKPIRKGKDYFIN